MGVEGEESKAEDGCRADEDRAQGKRAGAGGAGRRWVNALYRHFLIFKRYTFGLKIGASHAIQELVRKGPSCSARDMVSIVVTFRSQSFKPLPISAS